MPCTIYMEEYVILLYIQPWGPYLYMTTMLLVSSRVGMGSMLPWMSWDLFQEGREDRLRWCVRVPSLLSGTGSLEGGRCLLLHWGIGVG